MVRRRFRALTLALLVVTQLFSALPAVRSTAFAATRQATEHATAHATAQTVHTVTECSSDAQFDVRRSDGGTVVFDCGEATITVNSTKTIEVNTVIDGGGKITLSGGDLHRIFIVNPNVTLTLRNITLIEGYADGDGGAIFGAGQSNLIVEHSTLRDNHTTLNYSGGAIITYGSATISDSRFEGNSGGGGGAFYARWGTSTSTIDNTEFVDNHALSESSGWGGAILLWDGALLTVRDAHFERNSAHSGGAIYNTFGGVASELTIERSTVVSNSAEFAGGGIYNQANLQLLDTVLQGNEAQVFGAGFLNAGGNLEAERVRVLDNQLLDLENDAYGGGIHNHARYAGEIATRGVVALTDSTVANNVARSGGGIYTDFDTDLTLQGVTISGHTTEDGGGLFSRGVTTISSSTFSGNSSGALGGAIFKDDGALEVTYSTFAGNGDGANNSIYFSSEGEADNLFLGALVAGSCASAAIDSNGFNLESGNGCGFDAATDKPNHTPALGPLADHGGLTLTHLPTTESDAVNSGGNLCPMLDQRGFLRPAESACDIGAVETSAPPLVVTPFTPPDDGPPEGVTPEPEVTPSAPSDPPPIVHSQVPNGVAPTISVSPQAGKAGDAISVSGKSPSGFDTLNIVSMLDGRTMGMVEAKAAANGNYALLFTIPAGTRPGPIEICATVTSAENAEFACAPLQITSPPAATLEGALPAGVTARSANLLLSNAAGKMVYSAPISANGTFNLSNISPGLYRYNVVGDVSTSIIGGIANINPAQKFSPGLSAQVSCSILSLASNTGGVYADPSRSSLATKQSAIQNVVGLGILSTLGGGGTPLFDSKSRPMGIYVSGVQNSVSFEAEPQANGTVQSVTFEFFNQNSKRVGDAITVNAPPWRTTFDVGRLAPSRGTRHPSIRVTPVVDGQAQCPYYLDIEVIANPFQIAGVQPNAVVWDAAKGYYRIQGIVPHIPGILPTDFQLPPSNVPALPYLGRFNNRLNAGIQVVGTLNLEGLAHLQAVRTVTDVYLMNQQLIPPNWQITLLRPNLRLNIVNLRETAFPIGPYPLFPDAYINTPFLEVPVISFFGLIDVTVNASAGLGAGIEISGYVKPFKPGVGAVLTATGRAHAELGVGIRLLAGLARAGATARLDAELDIPFTVRLDPGPDAEIDACLTFRFSVRAFASAFWGVLSKDATKEIAKWSGCVSEVSSAAMLQDVDPTVPDVLAAPVIAIGTNGTQLSAYVENRAAAGATPQLQVMARLRFAADSAFGDPVALSNAAFSADAPVVALVGPEQWPMVAWAEKKLTFEQATALGDDINAILQRQEIVYRLYRNGVWEPAVYLTDDALSEELLGDGLPALAGGTSGAVLAWTRDLDGNWLTRTDQRIAVTTFNVTTRTFAPFALLSGGGAGLNGDARVALDDTINRPYVVWVYDDDADLTSADDRRLALAYLDALDWVLLNPQPLPPRVDSPTITIGPEGLRLAFLVREPDPGGEVSLVGTNGVLWTANFEAGLWTAAPMLDAKQQPIFGEEPILAANGLESLLLFRRFGQEDDNSQYGQLALSRMVGMEQPALPLYLTDEPRQNWQAQLAINPVNGQAAIVRVSRLALDAASVASVDEHVSIAATEAVAAIDVVMLSNADDPVSILGYAPTADPALDPLRASAIAPPAGETFTISATVRNVGRENASGVTVRLYAGVPGDGTLLHTSDPLPDLPFNATATTAFQVDATGGEQAFYAEVVASGAEGSASNNTALLTVGKLTKPVVVTLIESTEWVDGLDIGWAAPKDDVVLGYRILRSRAADGPFDLVGESSVPGFTDVPLPRDETFCYALQSYNANTLSPRSEALCGKLAPIATSPTGTTLFMPRLQR